MAIPVVADADVLFGGTTRALLIHLDYVGAIHLHWSDLILDEMSRALVSEGRKPDMASAKRHEELMRRSLPNADVPVQAVQAQFAAVAEGVRSAKDTHVAATAQVLLAQGYYPAVQVVSLVTKNMKDFKVGHLAGQGIAVQRADAFLSGLVATQPDVIAAAFRGLRLSLPSAPEPAALLDRLAADGQVNTANALRVAEAAGAVQL